MLKSKVIKELFKYLCSFLLGAMLVFLFAFKQGQVIEEYNSKSNKIIRLGDVSILVADSNIPDAYKDTIEEVFIFSKDNYPFFSLLKDFSGKIKYFSIADGRNHQLVMANFEDGRISKFALYGNEVHDNRRMPILTFSASEKKGVWDNVQYFPTVNAVYENGNISYYAIKGEMYYDIDFDGQFDVKSIFNEEDEMVIISQSIYIDEKWFEVNNSGSNGQTRIIGYYDAKKMEAATIFDNKKMYFDFEFGKGWKKRLNEKTD